MNRWSVLLSVLFCVSMASAQGFPDFKFRYLTMKDGLSNDYVTAIAQDTNGFIWLGTANGLNRYDGRTIKQFFHDPGRMNSLASNQVWSVCVDLKNRIWINTPDGLSCYDQSKDTFTNFAADPADKNGLPESLVNNVYLDANGLIWLSTKKGFYTVSDQLVLQKKTIPVWKSISGNDTLQLIRPIYRDNMGNVWTWDDANVFRLDDKSMQPVKAYPYSFKQMSAIFQDKKNRYWISTGHGKLFIFDARNGSFSEFKMPSPELSILHISQWDDGKDCWLVVPGFSLTLIHTKTLATKVYPPNIYNNSGYQGTYWAQLFTDCDNRLWMGYERGCNILQLTLQKADIIPIIAPGQMPYQEPGYLLTESFLADASYYWVHKLGGGLFQYDHQFKLLNYFTSLIPLSGAIKNETSYLHGLKSYREHLYVTGDFGLIEWNLTTRAVRYIPVPGKKQSPSFWEIIAVTPAIWWIRSVEDGIYVFDAEQKKIIRHYQPSKDCEGNCVTDYITKIYALKNNKIFITGLNRLWEYDMNNDAFTSHSGNISNPYITSIDADKTGMLWIGTTKGVSVYDPVKRKLIRQFSENRMIGSVHTILVDTAENVWCNTRSQLWCWVKEKDRWISYSRLDGLPAEVYECVLSNLDDGSVIAGIGEKLVRFSPDFLKQNQSATIPVFITDLFTARREISLTGKPAAEKKITLEAGENFLSVDFGVLSYEQPGSIRYLYKLEPSMKEFSENPSGRLTFNSLAPGTYTLTVKGADKLGNLTQKEDKLEIVVMPRWYQTLLFKTASLLVLAGIIVFFVSRRIAVIRREQLFRQQITETEIAALKAQLNPHFIFNCISSIDGLIQNDERYNATTYLNKFAKLIRGVLEHSKENTVKFSADLETLKLYLELEQLRNEDKYVTELVVEDQLLSHNYLVPPLIIQPFVENAIQHGLKNKPGKEGVLRIEIKQAGEFLQYVICDNGVGRKAAAKKEPSEQKSLGVQISIDRIRLFNNEKIPSVHIEDLIINGKPAGTMATIKLRLK